MVRGVGVVRRGGRVHVLLGEATARRNLAAGDGGRRRGGVARVLGEEGPHGCAAQRERARERRDVGDERGGGGKILKIIEGKRNRNNGWVRWDLALGAV